MLNRIVTPLCVPTSGPDVWPDCNCNRSAIKNRRSLIGDVGSRVGYNEARRIEEARSAVDGKAARKRE